MIQFETSRDGNPTAIINGNYLHSAYSPSKEASNFFLNNKLEKHRTIILIEPCLNYIAKEIKNNNNSVKVISIYFETLFFNMDDNKSDFCFLYSNNYKLLLDFLRKSLNELDVESLKIIEWSPVVKSYRTEISEVKNYLFQYIRELHGNITTISGFGKKLFKNFLRNYLHSNKFIEPIQSSKPLLIAGSGPSLNYNLKLIKKNRNKINILALPSSIHFLKYHSVAPDFIITTDPGYFALQHLIDSENVPTIAGLTSALTPSNLENGIIFFNQGYFLEKYFPLSSKKFIIPQHGSVAGSALYFSHFLTTGPIFITGLDFSYNDLISHNKPHSFDTYIERTTNRSKTLHTNYFERNIIGSERLSGLRRTNYALKSYSGWFSQNCHLFNKTCFFLESDNPISEGFSSIDRKSISLLPAISNQTNFNESYTNNMNERKTVLNNVIKSIIKDLYVSLVDIDKYDSGALLFNYLNNELIFNLFLPDLLEFKRHYINKSGKEVQNKAVSLIEKPIEFLANCLNYV